MPGDCCCCAHQVHIPHQPVPAARRPHLHARDRRCSAPWAAAKYARSRSVACKHARSDVFSCSLLLPPSEARARIVRESELDAQRKTRPICSNRPLHSLTCYDPDNAHSYTCVSTPPWGDAELSRLTRASGDGSGGLCLNGTRGRGACPPGSLLCRLHVTSLASGAQDVVAPSVAMPGVGDSALVSPLHLT